MKHEIQNKQVDNSSQPGPKPKTRTRVRVLQSARFGYTGANGNEAHQIQNKQVGNSSLYQTKPKTTRLQKRFSCGVVLMASTMLHEKCCIANRGSPNLTSDDCTPHSQCTKRHQTFSKTVFFYLNHGLDFLHQLLCENSIKRLSNPPLYIVYTCSTSYFQ